MRLNRLYKTELYEEYRPPIINNICDRPDEYHERKSSIPTEKDGALNRSNINIIIFSRLNFGLNETSE
jgi:hypothetical protein